MQTSVQQSAPPKRDKAYDLSTFRVLIVEDFTFISDLMSSSLLEMGVGEIMTSDSMTVAKEKILSFNAVQSARNLDVIVLDWLMPDGTGLELLQWIRNHRSDTIRYLPVIVCSAYASADLVAQSRDNGVNEVMVKPVSAEKMSKRILYVIEKPRPYIKTASFFGPDRRRKMEKFVGSERRVLKPEEIAEHHEQLS